MPLRAAARPASPLDKILGYRALPKTQLQLPILSLMASCVCTATIAASTASSLAREKEWTDIIPRDFQ